MKGDNISMKEKLKKIFKNRIFIFSLGILLSGSVSVFAVTYFPSDDVTYDNTESGLSSTNVQGAIDELYNTCTFETNSEQMIEDNNLEKDPYENRYFFTGANPNNYLLFNAEIWRILSIEGDKTIKIIKDDSIGNMAWNTSGSNTWSNASLKTYLNSTYLDNELNSKAKSLVVSKNFSVGAVTRNNNDLQDQINDENSTTWNGKVALPTLSEYLRTNSNSSNCGTFSSNNMYYSTCKNTTWIYYHGDWWTLSTPSGNTNTALILYSSLYTINTLDVTNSNYGVHPTLYLKSNLTFSGNGTSTDPYRIK